MVVALNVKSNIKEFTRHLSRVQRRQIPFATSKALNDTAFAVRKRIVEKTYPNAFTVRSKAFPRATFRVDKSTKLKLTAAVFDRLDRANLALHAEGGIKRPRGKHIAVPIGVKVLKSGKVGAKNRPRAILSRDDAFIARQKKGNPAIWRKTRKGLKLLYTLVPSARISKRFRFYEDAASTASRALPQFFHRALERALKTAR